MSEKKRNARIYNNLSIRVRSVQSHSCEIYYLTTIQVKRRTIESDRSTGRPRPVGKRAADRLLGEGPPIAYSKSGRITS